MKRKAPTKTEKLASALLTIMRPDEKGNLVPVINPDEAKSLSIKQILSRFEFDHTRLVAHDGDNHPSNLVPRPVKEHREKSRSDTTKAAKTKRVGADHEEFRRRLLAKVGEDVAEPRQKPKAKIKSRGFQGSRKFDGTIKWK